MLDIENVSMVFGGLVALDQVSTHVNKGSIHGLIGPNGSGKTTLINVITGFYAPTAGKVTFDGNDITGKQPNVITGFGLCRTFQNINLFGKMTVLENVVTPYCVNMRGGVVDAVFHTKRFLAEEAEAKEKAMSLLEFVGIADKCDFQANNLPYGLQRRLEIARALATNPKLLLLDEPVAGMNEQESDEVADIVSRLRQKGMTILLIEHHMRFVMGICDTLTVLNSGKLIAEGIPDDIKNNQKVIECYLGERRK